MSQGGPDQRTPAPAFIARWLWRDLRAGELTVLLLALVLCVASMSGVGLLAERARLALEGDARALLGGDLLLQADHAAPPAWAKAARAHGLRAAQSVRLMSMARLLPPPGGSDPARERAWLVSLRAVDAAYPLLGSLRAEGRAGDALPARPARGTLWADARFIEQSGARLGDWVEVGDARLRLAARLLAEPDQGVGTFELAPRLLLALEDLPDTGLLQIGARLTSQFSVLGPPAARAAFRAAIEPGLQRGEQLQGLDNARPELRQGLQRAQRFFTAASLLAVMLAGVALHLGARRYVERHLDAYAVLRCLGATQAGLTRLFSAQMLILGAVAGAFGALLGFAVQALLAALLGAFLAADLPRPGLGPAVQAALAGYVMLVGFVLPPLWRLRRVAALRVLRRETPPRESAALLLGLAALTALAGLLWWQTGDARLAAWVLGGFIVAAALFQGIAWGLLRLAARLPLPAGAGFAPRHALRNLRRRAAANAVQASALGLALSALLLMGVTVNDLLNAWQRQTPPDTPNRFVLNLQAHQLDEARAVFSAHGLTPPPMHPMVRGRLMAINGRPVTPERFTDERAQRLAEREFNLSYMRELPDYTPVLAGRWRADAGGGFSVEAGLAKTLGLKLGDELTFSVAGDSVRARIDSLRAVRWESMRVNFFIIAPPALLAEQPASYVASFYLPPGQEPAMTALVRALPNLTVIDSTALLAQARGWLRQLLDAVRAVFGLALASGVLVLYAALLATRDERRHEAALLRTLGASRAQLRGALLLENLLLGLLAGLLAASAAAGLGLALATRVLELDYAPAPELWAYGAALGLAAAALNAWMGLREVLDRAPLESLRAGV